MGRLRARITVIRFALGLPLWRAWLLDAERQASGRPFSLAPGDHSPGA